MLATPEWQHLHDVWPKVADTPGADISKFLFDAANADSWEPPLQRRFPWFGFLGATSDEDLRNRQAFFYGYANVWTTANAYKIGGGLEFAPVIQNTPTDKMLEPALHWKQGKTPDETRFLVFGKSDDDGTPQDRSHFSVVREIYGFLNLERRPFYNGRVERLYRQWFNIPAGADPNQLTAIVGRITAEWLSHNPAAEERLCELFRSAINETWSPRVEFESIELPKKKQAYASDERLDIYLFEELKKEALSDLTALSNRHAATAMLHLLLDSKVLAVKPPSNGSNGPGETGATTSGSGRAKPPQPEKTPERLPDALREYGERALAYLNDGFHVLFAGAPGTGKAQLAQFVGHAWDHNIPLANELGPDDHKPLTTVANSAWSTFHTIGGLMQTNNGRFELYRGIFIGGQSNDKGEETNELWRLRDKSVVLDEMNRADLDDASVTSILC